MQDRPYYSQNYASKMCTSLTSSQLLPQVFVYIVALLLLHHLYTVYTTPIAYEAYLSSTHAG